MGTARQAPASTDSSSDMASRSRSWYPSRVIPRGKIFYPPCTSRSTRTIQPRQPSQPTLTPSGRGVLDQLASVPLNIGVTHVPMRSTDNVDVYEVLYDSLDNVRVASWYCTPHKTDRPLPALLHVPGYQGEPSLPKDWARLGYASLSVAPEGSSVATASSIPATLASSHTT